MKAWGGGWMVVAFVLGLAHCVASDQAATVNEAVDDVTHGSQASGNLLPAHEGTLVHDGDDVKTGVKSRAEIKLPSASITRMGANTIYNYSAESNTVDLQAGTILFCKPKEAERLNIKTAAVTAGIVGTTGFISVQGEGNRRRYIFGLIEGHALAKADGHPFLLGPGDALEFNPGAKPFLFAYDVPRFVKSSPLIKRFHTTLPNQSYIDAELADYADDVNRGFIVPPSKAIDYSGDIPLLSTPAYDSARNSQQNRPMGATTAAASAPPDVSAPASSSSNGNPFNSSSRH